RRLGRVASIENPRRPRNGHAHPFARLGVPTDRERREGVLQCELKALLPELLGRDVDDERLAGLRAVFGDDRPVTEHGKRRIDRWLPDAIWRAQPETLGN